MSSNGPDTLAAPDPAATKWVPLMGLGGAAQSVTKNEQPTTILVPAAGYFPDGAINSYEFVWKVPADYVSGDLLVKVSLRSDAAGGAVRMVRNVQRVRDGAAQAVLESAVGQNFAMPAVANTFASYSFTVAAANFQAGDTIDFLVQRAGTDAGDTNTGNLIVGGVWVEYTGSSWASASGSGGGSADLVYNGEYPAATPYTDGDIVIYQGQAYLCVRPTSAAPTPWVGAALPGLVKLAEVTLGAASPTLLDVAIPAGYNDLVMRGLVRSDQAAAQVMALRFNGDAGNNYDYIQHQNGAGAWSSGAAGAVAYIYGAIVPGTGVLANVASTFEIQVPAYANATFFKGALMRSGYQTTWVMVGNGQWRSTAAINRVQLVHAGTGNFIAGSCVTIWGQR